MDTTWKSGSDYIERRTGTEYLRIEAWSPHCLRVRATKNRELLPYDWALAERGKAGELSIAESENTITAANGKIGVELVTDHRNIEDTPETPLRFFDPRDNRTLLEEKRSKIVWPAEGHRLKAVSSSGFRAETNFKADDDERFYGLGHNQEGFLNTKGCVIELRQMNSHTVVPVLYSSKGYGFFWNNPAPGRVELANNGTRWVADETDQLDYFIFHGDSPTEVLGLYAQMTGYPSKMPEWATGFWQCKLRYRTREELMNVAREHKGRGLPMSVIVIDFFHWEKMGEWDFDPACWPDPESMIAELKEMGIETMVSIWPMVNADSSHFQEMLDQGYLVRTDNGLPVVMRFTDTYAGSKYLHLTDFTNEEAGGYVWDIIKRNYYDRGVRLFWLDECEPEVKPYDHHNLRYHLGNGAKVSSLYPLYEEKCFYENMRAAGEERPINLCRSAWAGSQKYGACVWSGDIFSDFETLRGQIKNGLNMAMAGIPWWTTDIGGFFGGDPDAPDFRELVVRWFQWGVFCPVFRLHGARKSSDGETPGDNEVWSFGEKAYEIISGLLFMRERLRPYVQRQMDIASETGVPPMRPLFFDFPEDGETWDIDDELLFGPDILVAPVAEHGARERVVYLPRGAQWTDVWNGEVLEGGTTVTAEAPLERIPIYLKDNADVPVVE